MRGRGGDLLAMGETLLAQLWPDGRLDSWRARAVGGQVSLVSHRRCFVDAEPPPSPNSSFCLLQKPRRAWDAQGKVPHPTFSFSVIPHLQQEKFTWLWGPSRAGARGGPHSFRGTTRRGL